MQAGFVGTQTETKVNTYQGQRALQAGIRKMAKKGYVVVHTSTYLGKRGVGKFLIGFLAKQKDFHTVTFSKS